MDRLRGGVEPYRGLRGAVYGSSGQQGRSWQQLIRASLHGNGAIGERLVRAPTFIASDAVILRYIALVNRRATRSHSPLADPR